MNRPVGGYDAVQIAYLGSVISHRLSVPIGDHAARLAQDGFGAAGVPLVGARAGVDVKMRAAFGDQAEFQSYAAVLDAPGHAQLFADAINFRAMVRTAHRHNHLRWVTDGRDTYSLCRPFLLDECAGAGRGVIHSIHRGMVNHAEFRFAFNRQPDHDGEFAYAFDELFGAIHRINHPDAVFAETRWVVRELFGED